jgi:hypothetical protein
MLEYWNSGKSEEGSAGSGAGLCAIGTQAHATPIADIPHHSIIPKFQYSSFNLTRRDK